VRESWPETHRIGGKTWKIRHSVKAPAGYLGCCTYKSRTLHIPYDGESLADLDTIIHEALHAAMPYLDEPTINASATEVAKLLWKLGWRQSAEV
jgi:hypothetical protein